MKWTDDQLQAAAPAAISSVSFSGCFVLRTQLPPLWQKATARHCGSPKLSAVWLGDFSRCGWWVRHLPAADGRSFLARLVRMAPASAADSSKSQYLEKMWPAAPQQPQAKLCSRDHFCLSVLISWRRPLSVIVVDPPTHPLNLAQETPKTPRLDQLPLGPRCLLFATAAIMTMIVSPPR